MTVKVGDIVDFSEFDKNYQATVLAVRNLEHHAGANGEPIVHLGFFTHQPGLIGTQDQYMLAQFRLDVVHISHKFDKLANKAGLIGAYPGGRWHERNGTH